MLIDIALNIILPIFVLIALGAALDRAFRLDLPTLSKLNFYAFVPALVFVKVLKADLDWSQMAGVVGFRLVHAGVLLAGAWLLCRPARLGLRPQGAVVSMGAMFFNSGNYGIPFVALAFGERYVAVIAVVLMVQNFLTFTLGVWLMEKSAGGRTAGRALRGMLRVPVIYAIGAALVVRATGAQVIPQVAVPLGYLADGLIPVALLTLGVQVARSRLGGHVRALSTVVVLRLAASPLLAASLVWLFGFPRDVSCVLIAAAGLPVAVNVYILAAEYRRDEQLASQAVFWTTLLSAITLTVLLAILR